MSENPSEATLHPFRPPPPGGLLHAVVGFDRQELQAIFDIYGRMVAQGIWRDYALDFSTQRAIFSIFRRSGEAAFYRIVKEPKSARKQGAYMVVAQTGLILKRGAELRRILGVLEKQSIFQTIG
ncbi:DUF2794 domain-containing protein [Rhodoblastus sp.]|uniref:DUF2794 domain-containing protein n=1 Tax=Rhodoblastus sp. TaxID=1962975 RepID=UPI00260E0D55|nr:DUF2794 domain-containing protein [Rhodoblastus sp.]